MAYITYEVHFEDGETFDTAENEQDALVKVEKCKILEQYKELRWDLEDKVCTSLKQMRDFPENHVDNLGLLHNIDNWVMNFKTEATKLIKNPIK